MVHFLHGRTGVVEIRFPESSGVGVAPVSRERAGRLVEGTTRIAFSELGDAIIQNPGV